MLISTKGRYALRVMAELACHKRGEVVPLMTIAEKQDISEKYLESIIVVLSKAGEIEGIRGKGGGYRLKKAPEEYSIGEILRLTEGSLAPVSCLEDKPNKCPRALQCKTLPIWENLETIINNYLDSVSLADILDPSTNGDWCI